MQKFAPTLSDHERIQVMQDTAEKVEETEYLVPLTQEDLDIKREQFTDNSIWLGNENVKIKEAVSLHKDSIKPKATENAKLLQEITTKQEVKTGIIYHIADYDNSLMVTYDQQGDFVSSRRLRPDEKKGQSKLFIPSNIKTGTHN